MLRKPFKLSLIVILALLLSLTLIGCQEQTNGAPPMEPPPSEEPVATPEPGGILKAHFIDVGQGDAIFVQTPTQNILIDAGDRGDTVPDYLKALGVDSLDLVIASHCHADHIGGLINVFEQIPVKEVIDPAVAHTTITFEDYLALIDEKDIKFTEGRAGMTRDLGGATMELLHPTSPSSSHLNDASIVAKLTFGEISFLFTGDVEEPSEGEMLSRNEDLASTILKVPHHGSSSSSTPSFLQAVDPEIAVIMCGEANRYGHPHEETMQRLAAAGVEIFRTDLHGTVVIQTDGQTFDINIKQPYQYAPQKVPEEPDPEPAAETEGQFVGSEQSDRYHHPDCRHAENIMPSNQIWFNSPEEATNRGYTPCGVCSPQ